MKISILIIFILCSIAATSQTYYIDQMFVNEDTREGYGMIVVEGYVVKVETPDMYLVCKCDPDTYTIDLTELQDTVYSWNAVLVTDKEMDEIILSILTINETTLLFSLFDGVNRMSFTVKQ